MKRSLLFMVVAILTAVCAPRGLGQGTVSSSNAVLHVYINGGGEITPSLDGQVLNVGQTYELTATPDPGFTFTSWQAVNVFTFTSILRDPNNDPIQTNVSATASPGAVVSYAPAWSFTMQPDVLIYESAAETIARNIGWQANFDPIPEPPATGLILCGLLVAMVARRRVPPRRL